MKTRSVRTRLGYTVLAAVTSAAIMVAGTVTPAQADPVDAAMEAAEKSYAAWSHKKSGGMTLERATALTIAAINAAKTEIMSHMNKLATAEVRACADSAVINVADLQAFSPDSRQTFAMNSTECVTKAIGVLSVLTTHAEVNELGYALNIVAPIALLARASANLSTDALAAALIAPNNRIITLLTPNCKKAKNWGDPLGGGYSEVVLWCTSYTGVVGYDYVTCKCGSPLPTLSYVKAIEQAMRSTSYPLALRVLELLK